MISNKQMTFQLVCFIFKKKNVPLVFIFSCIPINFRVKFVRS